MTTRVRRGGAWRAITAGKARIAGSWRNLVAIRVYSGGAWRLVANFAGSVNFTLSPDIITKTGSNSTITAGPSQGTPVGGLPPFTYTWTLLAGNDVDISPSGASATFTAYGMTSGETRVAQYGCTCVDSIGSTSSDDVTVTIHRS